MISNTAYTLSSYPAENLETSPGKRRKSVFYDIGCLKILFITVSEYRLKHTTLQHIMTEVVHDFTVERLSQGLFILKTAPNQGDQQKLIVANVSLLQSTDFELQ